MSKLLLPLSVTLLASLSIGMPVVAETSTNSVRENPISLCSRQSTTLAMTNFIPSESLVAQVVLDSRPH
jgi:hypothetical protein